MMREFRFSPKLMIVSWSSPLHSGLSHLRPVKWSCTFWAVLTLKSRIYSFLHLLHISKFVFPWSSASYPGGTPLRRWSPSTFWLTRNFICPASMSRTKAMWVGVGMALDICVRTFFFEVPFFLAAFSHAPGPVGSTVLKPLRKSGIPADVEIPAPVNPIKCCDSRTH